MQHVTLLDGAVFKSLFDRQIAYWGKVMKDNNIRAQDRAAAQN